jgi:hypothetical protein
LQELCAAVRGWGGAGLCDGVMLWGTTPNRPRSLCAVPPGAARSRPRETKSRSETSPLLTTISTVESPTSGRSSSIRWSASAGRRSRAGDTAQRRRTRWSLVIVGQNAHGPASNACFNGPAPVTNSGNLAALLEQTALQWSRHRSAPVTDRPQRSHDAARRASTDLVSFGGGGLPRC